MARAQTAYLSRSEVPARPALQKALDALKLKLVLDDGYVPFESSGYLPCTLDGEDAGFTLRFSDVDAGAARSATLAEALGGRDVALDFKWSGDVREQVSAMGVCAALAGSFGALVHDPDKDVILDAAKLLARARAGLEEL
ncbi:hypothetical protein [Xanthobacter versatilis]|uniref:Uncharacterized protein n=1 Tax=Xanthobacter autotrophicus (strain ATCC BAA-1158 / Py2) TaxID=78245 RepID=A7IK00_XANP2|nr:conserved hypothetical protein [Xanthobacter autotrophicus Py2]